MTLEARAFFGFVRYLPFAAPRLAFHAGDERAQPSRGRRGLARRRTGENRWAHLGKAPGWRDVLAPADNPIGERDARVTTLGLAHLEARRRLASDIEASAVPLRRDEHVIAAALNGLGEIAIELDRCAPVFELRRAEILEPVLRALHAMEHALR